MAGAKQDSARPEESKCCYSFAATVSQNCRSLIKVNFLLIKSDLLFDQAVVCLVSCDAPNSLNFLGGHPTLAPYLLCACRHVSPVACTTTLLLHGYSKNSKARPSTSNLIQSNHSWPANSYVHACT